jgi:hypothetical protein
MDIKAPRDIIITLASRKRDTTWAEKKGKTEKRRVKNTMGYK